MRNATLHRLLPALGAAAVLSACSHGPDYTPPTTRLAGQFSLADQKSPPVSVSEPWWQSFRDPLLNALVDRALRENIDLQIATARVAEASAFVLTEVPVVDVNGRIETQIASSHLGDDRQIGSLGAVAGFLGPRARRIEAAKARVDQALAERDAARAVLLANLSSAYVDLRFVQQRIVLKQGEREAWQRTIRDVSTLRGAGEATRLDEVQPRAAQAETDAAIAALRAEEVRQKNRIATLLGTPAGLDNLNLGYTGHQPQPHTGWRVGVPADLLRNRPDIRASERAYRAAIAEIGVAEAQRYPSLSLSGTISVRSDTSPATGGLGAFGVDIPVFDQGARKAAVKAREAQAQAALLGWKSRVLVAVEEVETALASLQHTARAQEASRRAVSLNAEAVTLARNLLNGQEIAVLDFVNLQRTLLNAQSDLALNRRQFALTYVDLQTALGAGSQSQPVIPTN